MPDDQPGSSPRTGDPDPPVSRAVRRPAPSSFYDRVALGTVLPGAGLLRTRWRVLGWVLLLATLGLEGAADQRFVLLFAHHLSCLAELECFVTH